VGTHIHPTLEQTLIDQPGHPPSPPKDPRVSATLQGTPEGKECEPLGNGKR